MEEKDDDDKTAGKQERIVKDLKQMSQKEKMKLLKKESPELLELIQDFKAKVKHRHSTKINVLKTVREISRVTGLIFNIKTHVFIILQERK